MSQGGNFTWKKSSYREWFVKLYLSLFTISYLSSPQVISIVWKHQTSCWIQGMGLGKYGGQGGEQLHRKCNEIGICLQGLQRGKKQLELVLLLAVIEPTVYSCVFQRQAAKPWKCIQNICFIKIWTYKFYGRFVTHCHTHFSTILSILEGYLIMWTRTCAFEIWHLKRCKCIHHRFYGSILYATLKYTFSFTGFAQIRKPLGSSNVL